MFANKDLKNNCNHTKIQAAFFTDLAALFVYIVIFVIKNKIDQQNSIL